MSIDVPDQVVATQQAARRARRKAAKRAAKGVEAARAVDVHDTADVAKRVARRAAKRAAREAAVAAKRTAKRKTRRTRRKLGRVLFGEIAAGAFVGLVLVLRRRMHTAPSAPYTPPAPQQDPGSSVERPGRFEPGTDGGQTAGVSS